MEMRVCIEPCYKIKHATLRLIVSNSPVIFYGTGF